MGIRIQPQEVEVPAEYPFDNDCLERREPAEVLTSLIQGIEGPCVLSVDAAWGAGKTTFLRMWAQHLRNEGFPVVEFNAWKTDFADIPFVALSAELTDNIKEKYEDALSKDKKTKINQIKKISEKILQQIITGGIRLTTEGLIDVEKSVASYAQKRLDEYSEQQNAIKEFREALTCMAETLSELEQHKGCPLVVMIDELDRCRPTYAVEFLETAKHLFAVDNIVFVLAVNREQMKHSVRALYGNDFDAQKYLYRFFDLDFTLPAPDRSAFIRASLNAINIDDYFKRTIDSDTQENSGVVEDLLPRFFRAYDVSLRDIQQAIHRLGLVLASLDDKCYGFLPEVTSALILRTIKPNLYDKFIRNEVSDEEVINSIFKRSDPQSLKQEGETSTFEAAIILGAQDMRGITSGNQGKHHSPLWQHYSEIAEKEEKNGSTSDDVWYAREVIQVIQKFMFFSPGRAGMGFKQAVERLELLSPDLIGQQSTDRS